MAGRGQTRDSAISEVSAQLAGALLGLFVASYTGVLLGVSNQPVWSDTWTLGGLFLASGLSGAAALLTLVSRRDEAGAGTGARLQLADGYFMLIELVWILLFFATLAAAGTLPMILRAPWIVLWLVVAIGLVPPLMVLARRGRSHADATLAATLVLGATKDLSTGLAQGTKTTFSFTAAKPGTYAIACGVPGHATAGMWDKLIVSASAKAPSVAPATATHPQVGVASFPAEQGSPMI